MIFCTCLLNVVLHLVNSVESSDNVLSISAENDVKMFRLFPFGNKSIFDLELYQKYIFFNSDNSNKITARFGDFGTHTTLNATPRVHVNIHTDRRTFLIQTEPHRVTINCLCEFLYDKAQMSFLDTKFCCVVELHLNHDTVPNPIASCQMQLGSQSTVCFTPLTIPSLLDYPPIAVLTATINRIQSARCAISSTRSSTYATSLPLSISFSSRPPVVWHLSDNRTTKLLLGLPLHSSRPGENLILPLRVVSTTATVNSDILKLQCVFDDRINVISIIPISPLITVLNNFTFFNNSHTFHNIELQMSPRTDLELFSLNATVNAESAPNWESTLPTLQCCIKRSLGIKSRNYECGRSEIMTLPIEISQMIIIPALKIAGHMFNIYETPIVSLSRASVKVYGIVNMRDRTVSDMSSRVDISVVDPSRLIINGGTIKQYPVHLNYQNYINPWSMQLSLLDCRYTILSPMNIWKADSWRMVLSDNVLRPIKEWVAPISTSNREICVPRFKVVQLKILCRLYILDELGRKIYSGLDNMKDNIPPFIDVTRITLQTQFRVVPANVISVEKSKDSNYFIVSANEIVQLSTIELISPETSEIISSTTISVDTDSNSLYLTDLIIHCVEALSLRRENRSISSIQEPYAYESITVTMLSKNPSLPCYILIFLEFSDKSVERVSFFDQRHYQMLMTTKDSKQRTSISDGELVTVKWTKDANISLFESTACKEPKLIFSKKTNWGEIVPVKEPNVATRLPPVTNTQATTNQTNMILFNNVNESSGGIHYTSLFIILTFFGVSLLCLIPIKLLCWKPRSSIRNTAPTCYNISASGFLSDQSKLQIRAQKKKLSAFEKWSSNCMKSNNGKTHSNEPYPPLLPPPGPISTNYDLTINELVCSDSAVDSGIELGKMSSYSSNTNPSNDICCSIEHHMPTFVGEDLCRQPPQLSNSSFGYYSHKDIMESIHPYHDFVGSKPISNLRPAPW